MTADQSSLRVALFGATSDIAAAVGRRYAEVGARLVIVGRDAEALAAAARDLEVRGAADVRMQKTDFSVLPELEAAARDAWQAYSGLDLALIAYGSLPDQTAAETMPGMTQEALTLNFTSPALLVGALATSFEKQGQGTIAVITSVAGDRGRASNYVYGAAKGGLQHFLEGLRHRLHGKGVAVLDIRPGFVMTKMTAHLPQSGPLWATRERVAEDILKAVEAKRAVLYTPWIWRVILAVVRELPRPLFHRTKL